MRDIQAYKVPTGFMVGANGTSIWYLAKTKREIKGLKEKVKKELKKELW